VRSLDNFDTADATRYAVSKASRVAESSEFLLKALANPRPEIRQTLQGHLRHCKTLIANGPDRILKSLGLSRAGLEHYFTVHAGLGTGTSTIYMEAVVALMEDGILR
jgi:hypothetical protein